MKGVYANKVEICESHHHRESNNSEWDDDSGWMKD